MKSFYYLRDACSQASFLLSTQPLTRRHAEGEPYHRSAAVNRPIDVALKLLPAALIHRSGQFVLRRDHPSLPAKPYPLKSQRSTPARSRLPEAFHPR